MSQNVRMRPSGISWPNAPLGSTTTTQSKYGAVTGVGLTYSQNNYPRKELTQTSLEHKKAKGNAFIEKYGTNAYMSKLTSNLSKLSLGGKGRKTRKHRSKKHRKTHRRR